MTLAQAEFKVAQYRSEIRDVKGQVTRQGSTYNFVLQQLTQLHIRLEQIYGELHQPSSDPERFATLTNRAQAVIGEANQALSEAGLADKVRLLRE